MHQSPEISLARARSMPAGTLPVCESGTAARVTKGGSEGTVAGILYKLSSHYSLSLQVLCEEISNLLDTLRQFKVMRT
ncbi:hypothetical protein Goshw_022696 [Gossypium schwendimanii]|uniref:Uncharacterized protein n=1 Tax=Gossypium schwendimanii TaxID=34291 RepID=A0A7J9LQE6_GOSSC|nr:hypothetical protein [Gossypium schwendimanii]